MAKRQMSEPARAAAEIRKTLKAQGFKVRARSELYSMGSSVDVEVDGDLLPATRNKIEAYCKQFQYGYFDGMTDCYEYTNRRDDLPQAKHVFVQFNLSDELKAEAKAFVDEINGIDEFEKDRYVWMVLSDDAGWGQRFWRQRKPKVRAA